MALEASTLEDFWGMSRGPAFRCASPRRPVRTDPRPELMLLYEAFAKLPYTRETPSSPGY
jgi:hypothetical protein